MTVVPADRHERCEQLAAAGLSIVEIAAETGYHRKHVGRILKGKGGDLYVCAACLRNEVLLWVDRFERRHPADRNNGHEAGVGYIRQTAMLGRGENVAHQMLAFHAGVNVRQIRGLIKDERVVVSFRVADAICCAMDRPELLRTTLEPLRVTPNKVRAAAGSHVCQLKTSKKKQRAAA